MPADTLQRSAPERLRLFIDETDSLDEKRFGVDRNRYLSLTGVLVRMSTLKNVIQPQLDALRVRHFSHCVERPVILHRTSIRQRAGAFHRLKDPVMRKSWGDDLFDFLSSTRFGVITVCVDKKELATRAWRSQRDPYHFAMITMLERYFLCLQRHDMVGDVIAECRNLREDNKVREAFKEFRDHKSWFIKPSDIQSRITCHKIKILPKAKDVAGLQLCDLVATPSLYNCFHHYRGMDFPSPYTQKIAELLENTKYLRNGKKTDGHGRVWRPK